MPDTEHSTVQNRAICPPNATSQLMSLAVTGRPAKSMPGLCPCESSLRADRAPVGHQVYGRKKRGVACNHQGPGVGCPHVATWAETEIPLAADLGDRSEDPRATAADLLRRALAALPSQARASGRVAMRADAGYFAEQLACAGHDENIGFAIGAMTVLTGRRFVRVVGILQFLEDTPEAIEQRPGRIWNV